MAGDVTVKLTVDMSEIKAADAEVQRLQRHLRATVAETDALLCKLEQAAALQERIEGLA